MYNTILYQDILNIIKSYSGNEITLIHYKQKNKQKLGYKDIYISNHPILLDIIYIIHEQPLSNIHEIQKKYNEAFESNKSYSNIYKIVDGLIRDGVMSCLKGMKNNETLIFCSCLCLSNSNLG